MTCRGARVLVTSISENDIREIVRSPTALIGSDGNCVATYASSTAPSSSRMQLTPARCLELCCAAVPTAVSASFACQRDWHGRPDGNRLEAANASFRPLPTKCPTTQGRPRVSGPSSYCPPRIPVPRATSQVLPVLRKGVLAPDSRGADCEGAHRYEWLSVFSRVKVRGISRCWFLAIDEVVGELIGIEPRCRRDLRFPCGR